MPTSSKPRKKFAGNKFVLTSREYGELNRKLLEVVAQLRQVQQIMLMMMTPPIPQIEPQEPVAETIPTIALAEQPSASP